MSYRIYPKRNSYTRTSRTTKKPHHFVYRNGRNAGYGDYQPKGTKIGLSKPIKKSR